jgi:hypothetical protein
LSPGQPQPRWSREYGCSADRLFAACLRTVTQLNWNIKHTDATSRTLSCAAKGRKIRLGGGQDLSLAVEGTSSERARVVLGWGYQAFRLFDHGEKDEISALFFATLERTLPLVPAQVDPNPKSQVAASTPPRSSRMVADLEQLASLHSRGVLTEEEFKQAKERVLAEQAEGSSIDGPKRSPEASPIRTHRTQDAPRAIRTCPHCKLLLPRDARVCPHCGSRLR